MDPSGQRARNIVLLVVLTVALPSLLLTALGAVAVSNEESASKSRLERQYKPILDKVAQRFNALMDQITLEAEPQLKALAAWASAELPDDPNDPGAPPPDFSKAAAFPFAVNFFVVDEDGALLVPRRPAWGEDPTSPLAAELREAQDFELAHEGKPEACERWAPILTREDPTTYCHALWALVSCRGAQPANLTPRFGCLPVLLDPVAKQGQKLRALASTRKASPDAYLKEAESLAQTLTSLSLWSSAWVQQLVARDAAARLLSMPRVGGVTALRHRFLTIAERPALLGLVARMSHPKDAPPATSAVSVEGSPRVVVSRATGGSLAGFELVPTAFDSVATSALPLAELPLATEAVIWPVLPPQSWIEPGMDMKKLDEQVFAWALLKKSGLAWELLLIPAQRGGGTFSLQTHRSQLYLWALVLLAGCLLAGIVYTVRSVTREARESRLKVDFVSSVSHDLRTPLTSIRMFTETLLLGRVKDREEEKECLAVIAQETERLSRLTQRILDFSRMEAGRKAYALREESVPEVVQQALDACKPLIEQGGFTVEKDLAAEAQTAVIDRDAIVEVLINLVTNAIKYSPEQKWLKVAARVNDGFVELSVADHGIGIARADQGRVFEKFYRVDCRRTTEVGGCGIGLSLVQHIVKAHRGEVRLVSEPGKGSTFTVRLPRTAEGETDGEHPGGRG